MAQVRERGIYNYATPFVGYVTLPWHFRKELEYCGCLDLRPQYSVEPFSITRWLNPDGGNCNLYEYGDEEPLRYSELDEYDPASWEKRFRPWEEEDKGCTGVGFFGYSEKQAEDYVDRRLYSVVKSRRFDRVGVAYPPFGGKPMICGLKDDKITIL